MYAAFVVIEYINLTSTSHVLNDPRKGSHPFIERMLLEYNTEFL